MSSTLSGDAKDALARDLPAAPHCREALRAGLLFYGTSAQTRIFRTQRPSVARLYWSLLDERKTHPIRKRAGTRLYRAPTYEIEAGDERPIAPRRAQARCDRRMEMRAAFLACGSLALPAHGYHLEFVPPGEAAAKRLASLLASTGHAAKTGTRKGRPLLYYKDVDAIVAILSTIGAFNAVLQIEDLRALKETKNRIRRLVNTEAANVDRAATAGAAQRSAIIFLADAFGLRNLSAPLREIAELRLSHPDETLTELGRRCRPAAGKSTVNGRMASLLRLARRLRAPRSEKGSATKSV